VSEFSAAVIDFGQLLAASLLHEGTGKIGLAGAGRTGTEQFVMLDDPTAAGELTDDEAVEVAVSP
jgi:hypothetical protein